MPDECACGGDIALDEDAAPAWWWTRVAYSPAQSREAGRFADEGKARQPKGRKPAAGKETFPPVGQVHMNAKGEGTLPDGVKPGDVVVDRSNYGAGDPVSYWHEDANGNMVGDQVGHITANLDPQGNAVAAYPEGPDVKVGTFRTPEEAATWLANKYVTKQRARTAAATEPFDAAFPVPAYPPRAWFTDKPEWLTPETKIRVDDAGRVAGYFYNAGQCLVHNASACPKPSPTNYAAFHQQEIVTDDGDALRVGVIGNTNGHADEYAAVSVAQAHYADPDRQLMAGCAYDDEHGGYFLGALVPGKTYGDVALIHRSALSGDWRPMPPTWWSGHGIQANVVRECEGFDCIGPTLVTRPGLPLLRAYRASADSPVVAIIGGVGGVPEEELHMATTRVEVPGGVTVTTETPAPVGPHPAPNGDAAMLAAPPPPHAPSAPPANPAPAAPSPEDMAAVLADHEKRISACEDALSSMMGAALAALDEQAARAAALPVPIGAAPFPGGDQD